MGVNFELLIIAALVVANGVFAAAEIAVVASRKLRLEEMANRGVRGARTALELALAPDRFLATIQFGITLIGVFAGAFAGATVAESLAARLRLIPWLAQYAEPVAVGTVVVGVTFVSLVFGELVPKRAALVRPERYAAALAAPMRLLSKIGAPVVGLLSVTTRMVVKLLRLHEPLSEAVTEEEIRLMFAQARAAGVIRAAEHEMLENVLQLGDRKASHFMRPRAEIVWLDLRRSWDENRTRIAASGHSQFPVCDGRIDEVVGVVTVKDVLAAVERGEAVDLAKLARQPLVVAETASGLKLLEAMRQSRTQIAVVVDEYGGTAGLLTLTDLLLEVVGEMPLAGRERAGRAVRREDGSFLIDGVVRLDEVRELLGVESFPGEETGHFQTLAGFVLARLRRIPEEGDSFTWGGWGFEVVDMDGNRIDKMLVTPRQKETPE